MNLDKIVEAMHKTFWDAFAQDDDPFNYFDPDYGRIDGDIPAGVFSSMARAAVEALGLTEEWRVSRESWHRSVAGEKVAHTDHVGPTDKIHATGLADGWDGAYIESRLVSPWVKADQ